MKFFSRIITTFLILLLTACGGGGGGKSSSPSPEPSNSSPSVNISSVTEFSSGDIVSLTANAADSDGSVASYAWSVDSASIALTDANKSQVSFIAPNVDSDATISLSVTVTDNKGATAKATQQIAVKKKVSLTIMGLVLNGGVIANADVTFTVGDSTFATKANAAGQYSITIGVGSKNLNTPITAMAIGDSANPTVKLAAQLNSISKLIEQAGSDKTLDAKENLSVNISNVTTAEYALLRAPTYWGFNAPIATDEQLQSAQGALGSSQKITMASYLQIISTDSRFKLPDPNKNTLDFLRDQAAVNNYSNQVYVKDPALISNTTALINADKNLVKNHGSMAGQYLLYNQTGPNSYRLTLNEDLTGKIEGGSFTASVKWIQDGSKLTLNLPVPVETIDLLSGSRFVIKTAELNVYNNYFEFSLANFILFGDQIYSDDSRGYASSLSMVVMAYNTAKFVPLTAEKIAGEWMSDAGSYKFNPDKTASYTPYHPAAPTVASNWSFDNNKLVLQNDTVKEEFYLLNDLGAGYSILKIYDNHLGSLFRFANGWLIKPQSNLQLKSTDFVGSWIDQATPFTTGNSNIRVMAGDNKFFTSFAAWPTLWSSKEGSNSWERNVYLQNSEWVSSCDLSAGTHPDCKLYRNYTDKVIAVKGDRYYSLHTEKIFPNSGESLVSYSLVQSIKLPEITHFGQWIADNAIKVFYQKAADGIKVWNFLSNKLIINNKSLADRFPPENAIVFSLTNNRLQYTRDNVARELMLVSASENGLTVCEYNQGASCLAGTEFLLSNRSPAKISLKVEGPGTISPLYNTTGNPAAWFGNVANFYITPDAGALIKSVTGCGGSLQVDRYVTAEIRDACTITATFSKLPVITLKAGAHGAIKNSYGYEYSIIPEVGYMVETATGCNGVLTDGQYPTYAIKDVPSEDCTITVNFIQKLSSEAKITDLGLISCVDTLSQKSVKDISELNCQNDVIRSLDGIQNLPNLKTLILPKVVNSTAIVVPKTTSLTRLELGSWRGQPTEPILDITAIDFSQAENINWLTINGTNITKIDLSKSLKLEKLYLQHNPNITSLDLSHTKLTTAILDYNGLTNLILPTAGTLEILFANGNKLTDIDLSQNLSLKSLRLNSNLLKSVDLRLHNKLLLVALGDNLLTEINFSDLTSLMQVELFSNKLVFLDVSKNTSLETLDVTDNQLTSIDLHANTKLWALLLYSNKMTSLDVGGLTALKYFRAYDNKLTTIKGIESIDASSEIDLHSNLFDANTLVYLNNLKTVKNYAQLMY